MNNLFGITKLKNNYFVMRHGRSQANQAEVISSNPAAGTISHGLTDDGKAQAESSVSKAKSDGVLDESTLIFASDFTRTRETAEVAKKILGANEVTLTAKLRERYFGDWDQTHTSNYQKVWDDDIYNPLHKNYSVESTDEVLGRTTGLIKEIEDKYAGKTILLVSHGDALQILQTAFEQVSPGHHRSLRHMEVAEIRELDLK